MLNHKEKQMIVMDMGELIRASGEIAEILRPSVSGAGGFAGPHEPSEESLGTVAIEFRQLSPEELKQIGADGVCSMLPETDVAEGDIVVYDGARYRVTDIKRENCFGAVTHLTVKLEREYQQQQ
ncbi:MAG: hypothetical protein P9X24_16000 [Candidatus Hatepunaea meridiana]|nr:hypothetical protein [Candidatus Hatepunaea meridiana]